MVLKAKYEFRNLHYTGKFPGETDTDVMDRLSLVKHRDVLKNEVNVLTQQLLRVTAELEVYKSIVKDGERK